MATKVEIFNYKTIKHVVFTIEGYTLLLGKNFIGKSALITAIMSALTNRSGEGFIRHGEKFAEVRITLGDFQCTWHKEKNKSYYILSNGGETRRLDKIGQADLPREIVEAGFGPIEINKKKNLLWYARQLEVLFLVDKPKQNSTTDLIASVTKLDAVYKAVELAKKDLKSSTAELKVRKSDLREATARLAVFKPLEEFSVHEESLKPLLKEHGTLDRSASFLEKSSRDMREQVALCQKYKPARDLELPDMDEAQGYLKKALLVGNLAYQYSRHKSTVEVLDPVKDMPPAPQSLLLEAEKDVKKLGTLEYLHNEHTTASLRLAREPLLQQLPEVHPLLEEASTLDIKLRTINTLIRKRDAADRLVSVLKEASELVPVDVPSDLFKGVDVLNRLVPKLEEATSTLKSLHADRLALKVEREDILKKLSEFKECPFCGDKL